MKKLIIAIVAVVLVSGCIGETLTPYQRNFAGVKLTFRGNLDEAVKVPVYPNRTFLKDTLVNNNVQGIGIAYIPKDGENGFYAVTSYELTYKLTIINKYYFNESKPIRSIPVNSSIEAFSMASPQMPIIMLIGPENTNETMVNVAGSFITVQAKSFEEVNVSYTDLDLAADKLLLVLMSEVNI
jgi:hypothetical protein